jgi:hypothetical protein
MPQVPIDAQRNRREHGAQSAAQPGRTRKDGLGTRGKGDRRAGLEESGGHATQDGQAGKIDHEAAGEGELQQQPHLPPQTQKYIPPQADLDVDHEFGKCVFKSDAFGGSGYRDRSGSSQEGGGEREREDPLAPFSNSELLYVQKDSSGSESIGRGEEWQWSSGRHRKREQQP